MKIESTSLLYAKPALEADGYLLPPYLEELIPADHVAKVVNKVVDLLDISILPTQERVWKQKTEAIGCSGGSQNQKENSRLSKRSSFQTASQVIFLD
jgi:hypothetical protein